MEMSSFYTCVHKITTYDACVLRYGVWKKIFCHFRPFFALLPHYWTQKLKFGKNAKNILRDYPFSHVLHKWRSYHVWFPRYKSDRQFFIILGHFLPFDPPNNPNNQNFEKMKTTAWWYSAWQYAWQCLTLVYHKWWSHDVQNLRMEHDRIFRHFVSFFVLLAH